MIPTRVIRIGYFLLTLLFLSFAAHADNSDYCQAPVATIDAHTAADASLPGDNAVIAVQVITRHGDRAPINLLPYEGDIEWECPQKELLAPYGPDMPEPKATFRVNFMKGRNALPGNCALQQLTSKGASQHVALGKALNEIYSQHYGIVPSSPPGQQLSARSTNTERTLASAQSLLTGFYGNSLLDDDDSLPIAMDIWTMDSLNETMSPNTNNCPYLTALYSNTTKLKQWKDHETSISSLKKSLAAVFGETVFNVPAMLSNWADGIMARHCHGHPEPAGLDDDMRVALMGNATWEVLFRQSFGDIQRFSTGLFLAELTEIMDAIVSGEEDRTFFLNSGHDSSILGMVQLLTDGKGQYWPPYCSHMELELIHHNNSEYWVRQWYNDDILDLPCSNTTSITGVCTYDGFKEYYKSFMLSLEEYQKACAIPVN